MTVTTEESLWHHSLAAAKKVKMYAFPSHSIVPGPRAASSRADRVPTTEVSTRLQYSMLQLLIFLPCKRRSCSALCVGCLSHALHAG